MNKVLMTAAAALVFAATPATAQLAGGEAEVSTDTEIDTDFANSGAETRTGVSRDVKTGLDERREGQRDWREDAQGGPYSADRDDAATRYGNLDADDRLSGDVNGETPQALSDYEIEQIRKAGQDAAQDIDRLDPADTRY